MTTMFIGSETEVLFGPPGTALLFGPPGTAPGIDLMGVSAGRITARTLVGAEAQSTFAGQGMLAGVDVGVSGATACRGAKARFAGSIEVLFADARGRVLARWRGAHAGRQVDAGSLVTHAAGLFEVTPVAPPGLRSLSGQSALAEIRVTDAGLYDLRMGRLAGRQVSGG